MHYNIRVWRHQDVNQQVSIYLFIITFKWSHLKICRAFNSNFSRSFKQTRNHPFIFPLAMTISPTVFSRMILFLETDSRVLNSLSIEGTGTSGDIAFSTYRFFTPLDLTLDTLGSSLKPVSRYQSLTRSALIPVSRFLWSLTLIPIAPKIFNLGFNFIAWITCYMFVSVVSGISAVSEVLQNFKMDLTSWDFWFWRLDLSVLSMGIETLTTSCLAALTKLTGLQAWYAITNLCRTWRFILIACMSYMAVEVSTLNRL